MLASTKLVRKIVRSINNGALYGYSYTDKHKKVDTLRNVTFFVYKHKAEALAKQVEAALFIAGYKNKVKVTTSKEHANGFGGGNTYLRISNCVLS